MTAALLALLLCAAPPPATEPPLRVRVLERHHPQALQLAGVGLACDGQPLGVPEGALTIRGAEILVKGRRCREVTIQGAGVRWAKGARAYRGTLRVTVRGGELAVFNEVDPEEYLRGVLGAEQLAGAPEAMRAQAVVSRSFALASRGRHGRDGHDLCDLAHCQVYGGRDAERAEVDEAVAATAGVVLREGGRPAPGFFHACCGGATSGPRDVFGAEPDWPGVSDQVGGGALCAPCPQARWTWTVSRAELARALGRPARGPALEVVRRDRAGRVLEVRAFGKKLRGQELASRVGRAFGWLALKSLRVEEVEEAGGKVRVHGRGLGHGVGMCQWGSRALAQQGKGWRDILRHYFPAAEF